MVGAIILQIVLLIFHAAFTCAEAAASSVNTAKIEKTAEKGDRRAKRLIKLISRSATFPFTIRAAICLLVLLSGAFAAISFSGPLADALSVTGLPERLLNGICVLLIVLVLLYIDSLLGEQLPRRIAIKNAEKIALKTSGFLCFVSAIFTPLVRLIEISADGISRLFGMKPDEYAEEVTGEEIIMMAEAGNEKGSIDTEENEFIKNVFEFKELTVGEVCTHRKDTDLLFMDKTDGEWRKKINATRHTYYPVCGKGIDDVKGVLCTKDYFRLEDKTRECVMRHAVFPAVFVAENTPANTLFYKMKMTREYFAVVVDEYGGMSGIVTLHDLLEELVGELTEKDDKTEYEIVRLGENEWEITGLAPIDKVEETLGVSLPEEESAPFETFGGYVCGMMGTLPEDGSSFELSTDQMNIRVLAVAERCIQKVIVTLCKAAEPETN